jgi:uncharacterized delta-60 repeat protein
VRDRLLAHARGILLLEMRPRILILAGVLLGLVPSSAFAAGASLDPTFNGTGKLLLDDGGIDFGTAIAIQPDGKLLVATDTGVGENSRVRRLNPDGSLDGSWGERGIVKIENPGRDGIAALAVQADGKILAGGVANKKAVIYRFTSAGAPDAGFGAGGQAVLTTTNNDESVSDLALDRDGRIVAAGTTTEGFDAVVWRRKATDGSPDENFNAGGRLRVTQGDTERGNAVAIQPNGKIVLVGSTENNSNAFVSRLNADAGLDPAFKGGSVVIDAGGLELGTSVALSADGKILVGGRTSVGQNGAVWRFDSTGTRDDTFNDSGVRFIDSGAQEFISKVLVQPDGKILAIGSTTVGDAAAFYRLTDRGTFDPTFDGDGAIGISTRGNDSASDAVLQSDGNIVSVGSGLSKPLLLRLLGDPLPVTVTKAGTGAGTVRSAPAGIDCGAVCSGRFDVGSKVTLTATAAAGSTFAGWSGACAGFTTAVCVVEPHAAVTAIATFNANSQPATPTPTPIGGGGGAQQPGTGTNSTGGRINETHSGLGDTVAPVISAAKLSRTRFKVGARKTAVTAKAGTGVRFTLSEDAAVAITITRGSKTIVTLRRARLTRGANLLSYTVRTGRTKLARGRYRMTLVATDAAGNRSKPVSLSFSIV